MKILTLFALSMALVGCTKDPVSVNSTDNAQIRVEKLFTNNGCTIYRFADGNYHYYSDCRGSTFDTHTESCGKNCTTTVIEEIPTEL